MPSKQIRGFQMFFDDAGEGPPLVLLHGFPLDRSMWRFQIPAFRQTHRVIAPDLRGLGESISDDEVTHTDDMARDVVELLDALNIPAAVICGLSMGGYVAFSLYRQFPERVKALILADTRAQADTEAARQTRLEQAKLVAKDGLAPLADGMVEKLLAPVSLNKNLDLFEEIRWMIVRTPDRGGAAAMKGMAARPDSMEMLGKILVPALIIVGEDDAITPVEAAEQMHNAIRGSQLVRIPDCGHMSCMERPDEFNRAVSQFLKDIEA
jgi:3-oxoadipate enol-lactonase